MKFYEAIVQYSKFIALEVKQVTGERYIADIKQFCVYMRNCELSLIRDKDLLRYLDTLRQMAWTHNGVAKKCHAFRSMWKWFNKKGYRTFNYELIPNMKREWVLPRVATEEQYRKVLDVIPDKRLVHFRDKVIIMMLWDTGARVGEVMALNIKDLNLKEMKCVVKTEKSKGKRPFREVYWTQETNDALKVWLEKKQKSESKMFVQNPEALFWGSTNLYVGKRLTIHAVGIILRKYSDIAKIPPLNAHSFRHHMGHDLAEKGANNSIISSILGHSQLSSSFRYTELNDKEREMAYNKFKRKKPNDELSTTSL